MKWCREYGESKNPKYVMSNNGIAMLLSKFVVFNSKKSKFIKEQQARGLLSNLTGIEITIFSESPLIKNLF